MSKLAEYSMSELYTAFWWVAAGLFGLVILYGVGRALGAGWYRSKAQYLRRDNVKENRDVQQR